MCAVTLAVAASAAQEVTELTNNGQVVSRHVTLVNGQLMVPIRDVATYFGYKLSVSNGTAQLRQNPSALDQGNSGLAQPLVPSPATGVPGNGLTPVSPLTTSDGLTPPVSPMINGQTAPTALTGVGQYAQQGLFPTTQPTQPVTLTETLGSAAGFGGFDYKVDSIDEAGNRYKTVYDQRGETFHPSWRDDKLVVINMTVSNTGQQAAYPPLPGSYAATVFDDQKIGYPATYFDVRQAAQPDNNNYGSQWDIAPIQTDQNLLLAPGGKIRYAMIASVPKDRTVTQVLFDLPGGNNSSDIATAGGAILTVRIPK